MDFKERIYQARKAKGFSQEDLAELVGVSRQAVSKWETGEAMPDMEKLLALCSALELNIEYPALGKMPEQKQPAAKNRSYYGWALPFGGGLLGRGISLRLPDSTSNSAGNDAHTEHHGFSTERAGNNLDF